MFYIFKLLNIYVPPPYFPFGLCRALLVVIIMAIIKYMLLFFHYSVTLEITYKNIVHV